MSKNRRSQRIRRARGRVRAKIRGTADRPRLCVFRSNRHIYAQVINDLEGHTLAAAASNESSIAGGKSAMEVSEAVGQLVAERAKEQGVNMVVFDRNIYRYHGRVKAVAEGARKGGLTL